MPEETLAKTSTESAQSPTAPSVVSAPEGVTEPGGIVVSLPCGVVKDGRIYRDAEIVTMGGHTRMSIARKGVREDFQKVSDIVLRQCLRRVGPFRMESAKAINRMTLGDRDFALMEIRRASMGDELRAIPTCVGCKKKIQVTFKFDEIEVIRLEQDDFEIHDDQLCFRIESRDPVISALCRFPIGEDQPLVMPFVEQNPVEAQYRLQAACLIEHNGQKGPFDHHFFERLPTRELDEFARLFVAHKPGPVFEQKVTCPTPGCGADIEFTFESSDFLFPQPRAKKI